MTTETTKAWLVIAKRLDKKIRLHQRRADGEMLPQRCGNPIVQDVRKYEREMGRVDGLKIAQGIVADAIGVD